MILSLLSLKINVNAKYIGSRDLYLFSNYFPVWEDYVENIGSPVDVHFSFDRFQRDYYITLLKSFVNKTLDELDSIESKYCISILFVITTYGCLNIPYDFL